jgi:DNA (cytosine-5)-methyltransferase 1
VSVPRLLDAFSGAGGAGMGYHCAGFDVVGVDIKPQPHYPFRFIQDDALDYIRAHGHEYDAIHCSPPCQSFSAYRRKGHGVGDGYPDLIAATRSAVKATGRPYVIENVPGAPLEFPIRLCGSMFGLDVRRHRMFEASWLMSSSIACQHQRQWPRFPPAANRTNLRSTVEIGVWRIPLDIQRHAMGISWMSREELSQAVPPAYCEYLGKRLMDHIAYLGTIEHDEKMLNVQDREADRRLRTEEWRAASQGILSPVRFGLSPQMAREESGEVSGDRSPCCTPATRNTRGPRSPTRDPETNVLQSGPRSSTDIYRTSKTGALLPVEVSQELHQTDRGRTGKSLARPGGSLCPHRASARLRRGDRSHRSEGQGWDRCD